MNEVNKMGGITKQKQGHVKLNLFSVSYEKCISGMCFICQKILKAPAFLEI